MKKLVAIAALVMGVASPAFAQSYHASYGPKAHYGVQAMQSPGERAYAMLPASRINPSSPALSGGGSLGYNEPLDLNYR